MFFLRVERGLLLHLLSILWVVPPVPQEYMAVVCLYISSQDGTSKIPATDPHLSPRSLLLESCLRFLGAGS